MLCLLHHLPRPRKRGSSRCGLPLFGIEYPIPLRPELVAKAFYSPQQSWGGISLNQTTQKPRKTLLEAFRGLMPPFLIACAIL